MLVMQAGIMYSYGVFFKQLTADFGWSRAATSGVHSLFMLSHGGLAIFMGWLVDRAGPAKIMAFCGFAAGLGLVLTSRISALWQLYLTYGLIVGVGLSGHYTTATATTARWFIKRRGLALGIVTSGVGLGTLILVPVVERLITVYGWSTTYFILGVAAAAVTIPTALFLKRDPAEKQLRPYGGGTAVATLNTANDAKTGRSQETGMALKAAALQKQLWMLFAVYFLFNFCLQMVMVHLVNYATDMGIESLIAATFISIIGMGSFSGRLIMGSISDRIGASTALLICCAILMITMVWLIFSTELWMFYLFAIVFGFAYGGEVPQMPVLIGQFFGLRGLAALVGVVVFGATSGGAVGAWVGGEIFDVTHSYQMAFIIAAIAGSSAVVITLAVKRLRPAMKL
jgi:MFS family permease